MSAVKSGTPAVLVCGFWSANQDNDVRTIPATTAMIKYFVASKYLYKNLSYGSTVMRFIK